MICKDVRSRLDLFMDRQLPDADMTGIETHVAGCRDCEGILTNRKALRVRVKSAVRNEEAPADLGHRVQFALSKAGTPRRYFSFGFGRPLLAVAAACVMMAGAYYYWPEREALPKESQSELIARVSGPLAPLMRVGFRQHMHCGIFREYPAVVPALADLAREKAVSPGLINAVASHMPPEFHVALAHRCSYLGREYSHIVARGEGRTMSLLITRREGDENFAADLRDAAAQLDIPVYAELGQAGQDSYSIDAFEASGYVVFLISDLKPEANRRMLEAMAPQVRAAII